MSNLNTIELKAFIPAKNFELSKQFYVDFGFVKASDEEDVAYFHAGNCSFLLQNFYTPALAENLMMHLLVEDIHGWYQQVIDAELSSKYDVLVTAIVEQPWRMLDFVVTDPSGVLWRIGQNI
ncbi:MAG: VOC family protein [SAR86 cluster bacterium]